MRLFQLFLMISTTLFFTSCSSLNYQQKQELKEYEASNLKVEEKNETTAALLNVLPGFGDFYNGNPGYGVANLLMWPMSILWAPVGGASGAEERNYFATVAQVEKFEKNKKKLKGELEVAFLAKRISKDDFYIYNKKIDLMSLSDFKKEVPLDSILMHPHPLMEDTTRLPSSSK